MLTSRKHFMYVCSIKLQPFYQMETFNNQNFEKMTFKDYYEFLGKKKQQELRNSILADAGYSLTSKNWWRWVNGTRNPPFLIRKMISDKINIPVDVLFPKARNYASSN
jgi:hypothetical protein